MKIGAALVIAGYVGLVVLWGWVGMAAAVAHAAILMLAIPRK